jgi:hypothetical protein
VEIQLTYLLKEFIVTLGAKRTMLRREKENIDTLVIGSSHGDYGFDPSYFPGSFNLCCRSQDLKHSYYLYNYISNNFQKIKNVVLFYSIFSPGNMMEKSPSEQDICPALNEIFNLNLEYEDEKLRQMSKHINGQLGDLTVESDGMRGFLPNYGKTFFPESYGAQNRVNDHMKANKRTEANIYLIKLLLLAKYLNHQVCVVIPPVRSDYKDATGGDSGSLFRSLHEILFELHIDHNAGLINCFDMSIFADRYFGDYDHLQPLGLGAEILSKIVFNKFIRT